MKDKISLYSFLNWEKNVDNDELLLIFKVPNNYILPSNNEIRILAESNYFFNIKEEDTLAFVLIKELCIHYYHKGMRTPVVINPELENTIFYKQKKLLFDSLSVHNIQGVNYLDKALKAFVLIMNAAGKTPNTQVIGLGNPNSGKVDENKKRPTSDESMEDLSNESIFRRVAKRIVSNKTGDYSNHVLRDLLNENRRYKPFLIPFFDAMMKVEEFGDNFNILKAVKFEKNPDELFNTEECKISGVRDIKKLSLSARMDYDFMEKVLNRKYDIPTPVSYTYEKQRLIIIADFSGSMSNEEKQLLLAGFLLNRLNYVIKGECEIYFSYFVDNVKDLYFHHAYNKESALKLWRNFIDTPNGGGTRVDDMIKAIFKELKNPKQFFNINHSLVNKNNEIIIINDGEDLTQTSGSPVKINSIVLENNPNTVGQLAINSGGSCIHFSNRVINVYEGNLDEPIKRIKL